MKQPPILKVSETPSVSPLSTSQYCDRVQGLAELGGLCLTAVYVSAHCSCSDPAGLPPESLDCAPHMLMCWVPVCNEAWCHELCELCLSFCEPLAGALGSEMDDCQSGQRTGGEQLASLRRSH